MIINPIIIIGIGVKIIASLGQLLVVGPAHDKARENLLKQIHAAADASENADVQRALRAIKITIAKDTWKFFRMYFRGLWYQRVLKGHVLTATVTAIVVAGLLWTVWHYVIADHMHGIFTLTLWSVAGVVVYYALKSIPPVYQFATALITSAYDAFDRATDYVGKIVRQIIDEQEEAERCKQEESSDKTERES